jgi:hypothetical protein
MGTPAMRPILTDPLMSATTPSCHFGLPSLPHNPVSRLCVR